MVEQPEQLPVVLGFAPVFQPKTPDTEHTGLDHKEDNPRYALLHGGHGAGECGGRPRIL